MSDVGLVNKGDGMCLLVGDMNARRSINEAYSWELIDQL